MFVFFDVTALRTFAGIGHLAWPGSKREKYLSGGTGSKRVLHLVNPEKRPALGAPSLQAETERSYAEAKGYEEELDDDGHVIPTTWLWGLCPSDGTRQPLVLQASVFQLKG